MASSAQRKGKGYERRVAKLLSDAFDCNVRRTPCSGGLDIKGDLRNLSGVLENWVIEVKKQERLNIWKAMQQAAGQAGSKNWLLVFSRNNAPDFVCMDLQDWIVLVQKGGE